MFCPACGTNNEDQARFCYRCGRQLSDGTEKVAGSGPAWRDFVEPVVEPEPPPPPPEPEPALPPPPVEQPVVAVRKDPLPLIAIAPAVALFVGVFFPWLSVLGEAAAGSHFTEGKILLGLAVLASAGLAHRSLKPGIKLGQWLAGGSYLIAVVICVLDLIDPKRIPGAEINAALAEANLSVEREWGLFFVLLAAVTGAGLVALLLVRDQRDARRAAAQVTSTGPAPVESMAASHQVTPSEPESPSRPLPQVASAASTAASSALSSATQVLSDIGAAVQQGGPGSLSTLATSRAKDVLRAPGQVIQGWPERQLPVFPILLLLLAVAVLAGGAYGAYYASQHVDINTDSLPVIGKGKGEGDSSKSATLVSLSAPCKDDKGQACNLLWDVTSIKSEANATRIAYELRATGQAGCQLNLESDKVIAQKLEAGGRFGPFLEGPRGRYYPLVSSEGFGSDGGNLRCDAKQAGTWVFSPITGEMSVKLRYPGLPPARIELSPQKVTLLPNEDPLSVIPVQATACQTVQNQPCRGSWEIGPYGLAADGSPMVFFAVRFEGPANCQVNWQADTTANKDLVARGEKGIRLIPAGGAGDLGLSDGGGLSTASGPQPCGRVLTGFWRFAKGNLTPTVELAYPDFANVQIPIRP